MVIMPTMITSGRPSILATWIMYPRPLVAASNSAATKATQEEPRASLKPVKIMGSAVGIATLNSICMLDGTKCAGNPEMYLTGTFDTSIGVNGGTDESSEEDDADLGPVADA